MLAKIHPLIVLIVQVHNLVHILVDFAASLGDIFVCSLASEARQILFRSRIAVHIINLKVNELSLEKIRFGDDNRLALLDISDAMRSSIGVEQDVNRPTLDIEESILEALSTLSILDRYSPSQVLFELDLVLARFVSSPFSRQVSSLHAFFFFISGPFT